MKATIWKKLKNIKTEDEYDNIQGCEWQIILINCPEFYVHCRWDTLTASNWTRILIHHPAFIQYCDCLEEISNISWRGMIKMQPLLSDLCPWHTLTGMDLAIILINHPQLINKMDLSLLTSDNWKVVVKKLPELTPLQTRYLMMHEITAD